MFFARKVSRPVVAAVAATACLTFSGATAGVAVAEPAPADAPASSSATAPTSLGLGSLDSLNFNFALFHALFPNFFASKDIKAPTPSRPVPVRPSPSAPAEPQPNDGSPQSPMVLQGDFADVAGERVLVCATGNGAGISHVGVTASPGAPEGDTQRDAAKLCSTAYRVMGALLASDMANAPGHEGILARDHRFDAGGPAECKPAGEATLRCETSEGPLVTIWSVAHEGAN
ncbi:hypothetical protein [Corynebacterium sp. H113]|uniref:hypothetical protein n=1 Tax=Corynebacterium sp. H113 TaxID=3133419 RepID=UPI003096EB07